MTAVGVLERSGVFRTGLLLVAIPLTFQLFLVLAVVQMNRRAADADAQALRSRGLLDDVRRLQSEITRAHGALRGAVLLQDAGFEIEERRALDRLPQRVAALRQHIAEVPELQAQFGSVSESVTKYRDWFLVTEEAIAAREWRAAAATFRTRVGKRTIDATQASLDRFLETAQGSDAEKMSGAARARRVQEAALVFAAALAVVVAVSVIWIFSRGLARRLGAVAANARHLAAGEPLAARLPGKDEVASLDAVLHDTSARLSAAAAAERRYAAEIESRRAELEQANQDLRYQSQENEMFVYSVSHDLRAPLVNLQGFTQELEYSLNDLRGGLRHVAFPPGERERLDAIVVQDIPDSMRFIRAAVTRLSGIVDALLRLSRAGRVQYRTEPVALGPVVDRIVDSMRGTAEAARATVVVEPLPVVQGDSTAVEQVFANLVANAFDYLDPQRPGVVRIGAVDARDGLVTIFVRDNGRGIPSTAMSKLFIPFERLHPDVTTGEGVGLALVKRIVDRHGGKIWLDSTEGTGTTVFVALPAATAQPAGLADRIA